jgi:hypothetical protein
MDAPKISEYRVLEFADWNRTKTLDLTPKFQRRSVWKTPAKSYFIDSILRGIPIPPLFLRLAQSADKKRVIREVIDGQQRLRSVLEFLADSYSLSKSLDGDYAGKKFSELSDVEQDTIKEHPLLSATFTGISDAEVLEIFARVNTYSVQLNLQELRNGTYFGYFKTTAYKLAFEYLEFWRTNKIFTENGIARMEEVELTSELLIAQMFGQQDKKSSIDSCYERFDDEFPQQARVSRTFRKVLDSISEHMGDILQQSQFSRRALFYSLFCVVYHRVRGLPGTKLKTPKRELNDDDVAGLKDAIITLSEKITAARDKDDDEIPSKDAKFINACSQQTDNIQPRRIRFETLYKAAFGS